MTVQNTEINNEHWKKLVGSDTFEGMSYPLPDEWETLVAAAVEDIEAVLILKSLQQDVEEQLKRDAGGKYLYSTEYDVVRYDSWLPNITTSHYDPVDITGVQREVIEAKVYKCSGCGKPDPAGDQCWNLVFDWSIEQIMSPEGLMLLDEASITNPRLLLEREVLDNVSNNEENFQEFLQKVEIWAGHEASDNPAANLSIDDFEVRTNTVTNRLGEAYVFKSIHTQNGNVAERTQNYLQRAAAQVEDEVRRKL